MKKTLIAAAVMAASGVAFAASNVTLYGVIDTGLLVSKVKHKDTLVQMSTGFDSGSRWGIKGVEDLGNGYAVGFSSNRVLIAILALTMLLLPLAKASVANHAFM